MKISFSGGSSKFGNSFSKVLKNIIQQICPEILQAVFSIDSLKDCEQLADSERYKICVLAPPEEYPYVTIS